MYAALYTLTVISYNFNNNTIYSNVNKLKTRKLIKHFILVIYCRPQYIILCCAWYILVSALSFHFQPLKALFSFFLHEDLFKKTNLQKLSN